MTPAGSGPAGERPWLVPVARLRKHPGARASFSIRAPIGGLAVSSSWVVQGSDICFEGTVEAASGGVVLHGSVSAPFEGTCRRCLETASGTLFAKLDEVCLDEVVDDIGYGVGAEWFDLEPVVHDACILELPVAPLCAESCLGLCATCGVNRNLEACSCGPPVDARWAALSELVQPARDREAPWGTAAGGQEEGHEQQDDD
ncbi:MAG: YceD family protein [Acidimicrobiales bacterium]